MSDPIVNLAGLFSRVAVGGLLYIRLFIVTVSFMLSTPGVWVPSLGGFPAITVMPGQFLLKDTADGSKT